MDFLLFCTSHIRNYCMIHFELMWAAFKQVQVCSGVARKKRGWPNNVILCMRNLYDLSYQHALNLLENSCMYIYYQKHMNSVPGSNKKYFLWVLTSNLLDVNSQEWELDSEMSFYLLKHWTQNFLTCKCQMNDQGLEIDSINNLKRLSLIV